MQEKEVHPATEKGFNSIPEEPRTRKVGQLHPVERPDPQPREKGHSYTEASPGTELHCGLDKKQTFLI